MLTYYIDSVILPRYKVMEQRMDALQSASESFLQSPSSANQANARQAYEAAHLQYERITAFQFGPAETALQDLYLNFSGGLDVNFNTVGELNGFSVDTPTIENNIATGTYDLAAVNRNSFYSQGFPALGYLLFAPNAISKFGTNTARRVKYVQDVVARMKSLVNTISAGWASSRNSFIGNTQTSVGSPIGNLVNQMAYQLDLMKGPRIGWPLGKASNGVVFPTKVEAYYAGRSAALAVENLRSLKGIYTAEGSGKGLSNYLVALGKTQLNTDVLAQFDIAIASLGAIPDPLSEALQNQPARVDAAYKEVQKLLTLLKTDVASATAVQINYMDNDGD